MHLSYEESLKIIGGISKPSKMPWFSWSISAFDCKVGSKLRKVENSTCSKCYALKGNYSFPNVLNAHKRRLICLSDKRFVEAFVIVLLHKYARTRKTYIKDGFTIKENRMRWHDAGDLQHVEHLIKINKIALLTPYLEHWVPTREYNIVSEFLKYNTQADNLIIRLSSTMIGDMTKTSLKLPISTVGCDEPSLRQCPAYTQEGKCKDCNMCWDETKDVNYPLH